MNNLTNYSYICNWILRLCGFQDIIGYELAFRYLFDIWECRSLRVYVFDRIDNENAHAIAWAGLIYEDGHLLQPPD